MLSQNNLFSSLCKQHDIKFSDMQTNPYNQKPMDLEWMYRNRSMQTYDEIFLGLYSNEELRSVSFFHEMGHILDTQNHRTKYTQEKVAWKVGFRLAKKHGFKFSKKTKLWCRQQLRSYDKPEYR